MKSPLKFDQETKKEFGIKDEFDLDPTSKLAFARTQRDEIIKVLWRERIDLMVAQAQVDSAADETMKGNHQNKVTEKRLLITQFVRSLNTLTVLVDELSDQTPSE